MGNLRAAFIAPCCGVGGGDGMMVGLMNNTQHIEWTGVAARDPIGHHQLQLCKMPANCYIHQAEHNVYDKQPGIKYHKDTLTAQIAAVKGADVIITWAYPDISHLIQKIGLRVPIINFIQNEDKHAKECVTNNLKYVSHHVSCSEYALKLIPEAERPYAHVLYNAVDPNRVSPRYGRDQTRQLWNITPERKVALFMGRIVAEKNPEAVIQALTHLPADWLGLFCGSGTAESLEALKQTAARFAPGRCLFVPAQSQVGDLLAAADVFCLPSDFEGIPLAMIESWLAGTPVVAARFGVMAELERKYGQVAQVVERRPTSEAMADAIIKADSIDNLGVVSKMRTIAWNEFTMSRLAAQWEEYLHTVVDDFRFKRRHMKGSYVQGQRPFEVAQ